MKFRAGRGRERRSRENRQTEKPWQSLPYLYCENGQFQTAESGTLAVDKGPDYASDQTDSMCGVRDGAKHPGEAKDKPDQRPDNGLTVHDETGGWIEPAANPNVSN